MKKVYFVRHAKSSWDDLSVADHDRPILEKGKKKTQKIGEALLNKKVTVDLILSSTALRAKETALLLADAIGYPKEKIVFSKQLYIAYEEEVLSELYALDNKINSVMVVAHNPTLTDLYNLFSGYLIDNITTSAVFSVVFKTDKWENISSCKYKLEFLLTPNNF